jgi:lysozyme
MRLSDNGHDELHKREGLKLKPYLDTQGIPTIAMGNTYYLDGKKVTMQDKPLTIREAYKLGRVTSDNFAKQVNALLTKEVTQNQFNALVSLAYNIGINAFKKSTVLKRVNANPNDPTIKNAFMMWTKNKELIGRRKSEVEQYFRKQI